MNFHCPKQLKSNSIQIKKRESERKRVGVGERKRKGKEGERGMQDLVQKHQNAAKCQIFTGS